MTRSAKSSRATSAPCSSPLIPGIPDDVVFHHILTKVSWKCVFVLPAVNRRWREEFRSRRVYKHRRSTGTDQQLIAVVHSSDQKEFGLSLFNLSDRTEWLRLPRIPGVACGVPRACGLVFLEGILYIIGGLDSEVDLRSDSGPPSPNLLTFYGRKTVYELDVAAGRGAWRTGVSMKENKGDFLCKAEEGRIHTAKFNDTLPVPRWEFDLYDPVLKSWTKTFDLRQPSVRSFDSTDKESLSDDTIWGLTSNSGEWHLHSVSFRDYVRSLGPDDDIQCWDVVPLDGELVITVSWPRRSLLWGKERRLYDNPSDFIFGLVMSRGLSSREQNITWNKIQFPNRLGWCRSFPDEGCNVRNGSFPVFFDYFPPQVYPCKL